MLAVRRTGRRDTLFAATHEPFANEQRPGIAKVTVLARTKDAVVVRIEARDYTDYAAATFGPQPGRPEHVLVSPADPHVRFAFRNYGYLRVPRDGAATGWGGWTGFSIPDAAGSVTLNGQGVPASRAGRYLAVGRVPEADGSAARRRARESASPATLAGCCPDLPARPARHDAQGHEQL